MLQCSPLKYSQSEIPYHKSVVVAQLGQKGHLMIRRQSPSRSAGYANDRREL